MCLGLLSPDYAATYILITAYLLPLTKAVLSFVVVCVLYWLFFCPLNRVRSLEEVGWSHVKRGRLRKDEISRMRRLRSLGDSPPPFPNGWYVILESRELSSGSVKQVDALGKNFSVFRGESGKVYVTGAYCPHLGANLAVGGVVQGEDIQCPFHLWSFSGDTGSCSGVPYCGLTPRTARLPTYHCLERNQLIYVWYHAEDSGRGERMVGEEGEKKEGREKQEEEKEVRGDVKGDGDVAWYPPLLEEVDSGEWVYQGRSEYYVNCHIQDISENGADPAHLQAIHKAGILGGGEPSPGFQKLLNGVMSHDWTARWEAGAPPAAGHTANITLTHNMQILNRLSLFSLNVSATQIGPATVHLKFRSVLGCGVMVQYVLPVEPMVQKLVHVFYTQRSWIPPYAKVVLLGESIHLERDIKVWNSKTYRKQPILSKEDKLTQQHRRWYSQFYSPNSRKMDRSRLEW